MTTPLVVVGASAGGVGSLQQFVGKLPSDFEAAVVVVLHLAPTSPSMLPAILGRAGPLPAAHPEDGERIEPGHVYVAPPGYHLLVEGGRFNLKRGATANGLRPAIDPLFRSAARSYEGDVIGVVLSGSLDDGTVGLAEIERCGGVTMVQDPSEAPYPDMPSSALRHVRIDVVGDIETLVREIDARVRKHSSPAGSESTSGPLVPGLESAEKADEGADTDPNDEPQLRGSGLSCPDCHGELWEVPGTGHLVFRCTVGHTWTELALVDGQARAMENTLFTALRILTDRLQLTRRMRDRAAERGHRHVTKMLDKRVGELERQAAQLQTILARPDPLEPRPEVEEAVETGGA